LGDFSKNYRTFYQKNCQKLLKIWSWDPGSEIWDPEKTYSGSRIQGSKRHRIPDLGSGSATLLGKKSAKLTELNRAAGGLAVLHIRLGKGQTSQDFLTRFWDYKLPYKFGLSAFLFPTSGVKISTILDQEALSQLQFFHRGECMSD
jgi:hypothetical protein